MRKDSSVKELITPSRAKDILEKSKKTGFKNRPLSKNLVRRYADEMAAEKWIDNGETIKISPEGALIDGQHRLHALIKANVSLYFDIAYNVPMNAHTTIDIGRKRSMSDFMCMDGIEKNAAMASAGGRGVYYYLKTGVLGRYNMGGMDAGVYEYAYPIAVRFYDDIQDASRLYQRTKAKIINMSNLLTSYILFGFIDKMKRNIFFENIIIGANLPQSTPEYKLRKKLTDIRIQSFSRIDYYVEAIFIVRAWNSFLQNLKRINFDIEQHSFYTKDNRYFPEIVGFDRQRFIDSIDFTEEQKAKLANRQEQ